MTDQTQNPPPAARSYRWLFWTMAVAGLFIDQGSKYWAFGALYNEGMGSEHVIIDNTFSFSAGYPHLTSPEPSDNFLRPLQTINGEVMPYVNEGALWGQQMGFDGQVSNRVFAIVSLLAALAIIVWSTLGPSAKDGWLCFALGLILAGAVGNLYDRIVFRGVRDFLRVYWFDFPIFNIADSCLVCGAGVLLIHAFFLQPEEAKNPATAVSRPEPVTTE